MKRLLSIISIASAFGFAAQAAPLSPEAALARALSDTRIKARSQQTPYTLKATRHAEGKDALYVFETTAQPGFIIAPADDMLPAVMGFGDSKIFDESGNFAPGFAYWLDFLSSRSAYAIEHPEALAPRREGEYKEYDPIDPLCSTLWNQSAPYNNLCPELGGRRSVTGCVATAMSQAMKYHNWPPTGEGYNEYAWQDQTLSMDFAQQTFDWGNMLDDYPPTFDGTAYAPSGTAEQKRAVAQLMLAAGISVNMSYSPDASGAVSMYIGGALGGNFRYDKRLQYLMRDYFELSDWEEIIYNSLKDYGPVIYDGQANIGGHSFICDGYLSEGYFHINWGWGGVSDGWFLLDYLDPYQQGIGGADSGFNAMQDAIIGIRPDSTGESEWNNLLVYSDPLNMTYTNSGRTITVNSMIYNCGPGIIANGLIGFRFTDRDDSEAEPEYMLYSIEDLKVAYGFRGLDCSLTELEGQLEEGHGYDVVPVYCTSYDEDAELDADFKEVMNYPGATQSYSFLYKSGRAMGFRPTEDFKPVGVVTISDDSDAAAGTTEYYTVSGVKVASVSEGDAQPELGAGVYIVRKGTKTEKVVIR